MACVTSHGKSALCCCFPFLNYIRGMDGWIDII